MKNISIQHISPVILHHHSVTDVKTISWLLVLCAIFSIRFAHAEYSISVLLNPQYHSYSSDTLFIVPDEYIEKPRLTSDQTIELTGGFNQTLLNTGYLLSARNKLSDSSSPNTELKVNELFFSKSIDNWELIAGRKISSWGVGYGFRPLDVIQQYDQQTTSLQSMIGKNQFALEYFADMSSWSLLWENPFPKDDEVENRRLQSFVAKYSTSKESHDVHALLRYNNENKLQLGLGGIQIISDSISLHGSLLVSQQYQKQIHAFAGQSTFFISSNDPYITKKYNNGLQALVGLSWSGISKHNVIAEYWYDEMAYTRQQWEEHFRLAKQLQTMLKQSTIPKELIYGNIAWTANATQAQSLAQHNLMIRWNYDADNWKPTINILLSPDDKSNMTTLSITRVYNLFKLEAGMRIFNGTNDSVYGGLIVSNNVFMTFSSEY